MNALTPLLAELITDVKKLQKELKKAKATNAGLRNKVRDLDNKLKRKELTEVNKND